MTYGRNPLRRDLRTVKDHGASWRHSADTATIERRSKVIDGRIRVARDAEKWRRSALERRRSQPLSASVAGVRGAVPVVPDSARPRAQRMGGN
jgi:hypothetical protein